jgi:predicted membrane metal-binding protein
MIDWVISNKEWVFSGIGVAVLAAILSVLLRSRSKQRKSTVLQQSGGDHSRNFQAEGGMRIDVHATKEKKR